MTRTDLTRELIVATALDLLDREGEAALSMRRLANSLGVGTMTAYHYVSDKNDLTAAVIELAFSQVHEPRPGEPWAAAAHRIATSFRAAALGHPAAAQLLLSRPGSRSACRSRSCVEVLVRGGLGGTDARRVLRAVSRYVIGWCLVETADGPSSGVPRTGPEDDEDFAFGLAALLGASGEGTHGA